MDNNIYYNPEKYGLTTVAEIDYSDGCYQFDIRIVWQDRNGKLWTARDSGCSCPSPFENDSLHTLEKYSYRAVRSEALAEAKRTYGYNGDDVSKFIEQLPR